jgi:acyl-coenzyme A thioesterase PaaI-like protein
MGVARPGESVFGRAEVYRVTDNVVFSRGTAYQSEEDRPIAHCVATFMRLGKSLNKSGAQP